MEKINWMEEVLKRKEDFLNDLKDLVKIKSVLDEENATKDAPLGEGVKKALLFMLEKGEKDGFKTKNLDHLAGHIEHGEGDGLVGVLCHVDVVPEGDGWTYDPFGAEIHDGKLYGRGAIDDKGPTIASYYALKIVKELGLKLSKRVRIIIGTDEESNWRCVDHYFKHEEMPDCGFAPDADFPIIHAEKGIASFELLYPAKTNEADAKYRVVNFSSGRRYNMVPDYATCTLIYSNDPETITENFTDYLRRNGLTGKTNVEGDQIHLAVQGVSAHAMEPKHGKNAALFLGSFLAEQEIDEASKSYFTFIKEALFNDTRANSLGMSYKDDVSGELTVNAAIFSYSVGEGGKIGLNFRYPVTFPMETKKMALEEAVTPFGFQVEMLSDTPPHYVVEKDPLIQTLQKVYTEQTGEEATLLAIGGGTYARSLKSGVAFGAVFPGKPDVAHQKDEYVEIDELLKACAIYAQAIYELAK